MMEIMNHYKATKVRIAKVYDGLNLKIIKSKKSTYTQVKVSDDFEKVEQHIFINKDSLIFITKYPNKIPAEQMPAATDLILESNQNMVVGSIDVEQDEGSVRFRSTLYNTKDCPVDKKAIKHNIMLGFYMAGRIHEDIYQQLSKTSWKNGGKSSDDGMYL